MKLTNNYFSLFRRTVIFEQLFEITFVTTFFFFFSLVKTKKRGKRKKNIT